MQDTILILSSSAAGSSLIARTLRWRQVYCTILPLDTPWQTISAMPVRGLVISADMDFSNALEQVDPAVLTSGLPLLALGGAALSLCARHGGSFTPPENQNSNIFLQLTDDPLFAEIGSGEKMLHRLSGLTLSPSLRPIALAGDKTVCFCQPEQKHYGVQYHIERNDPDGAQLLANFACDICGCTANWDEDTTMDQALACLRENAKGKVLCAVSGGVDSAVCAKLADIALGDRLECVFLDTGMFHQGEPESIIRDYEQSMGIALRTIDLRSQFLAALADVTDSLEKERISSSLILDALLDYLRQSPEIQTLVMGTNLNDALYGDPATKHLRAMPEMAQVTLLEPISNLFKNEVRRLAQTLMLPPSISDRQPFPAGGLALRIFGRVTEERLALLQTADICLTDEINAGGYDRKLWQFYCVLLRSPDKPDCYTISLRALQAGPVNATSARLPFDLLERVTGRILEEIPAVSRVVYDLTPSSHYSVLE